jgi:hypothetical protein
MFDYPYIVCTFGIPDSTKVVQGPFDDPNALALVLS